MYKLFSYSSRVYFIQGVISGIDNRICIIF